MKFHQIIICMRTQELLSRQAQTVDAMSYRARPLLSSNHEIKYLKKKIKKNIVRKKVLNTITTTKFKKNNKKADSSCSKPICFYISSKHKLFILKLYHLIRIISHVLTNITQYHLSLTNQVHRFQEIQSLLCLADHEGARTGPPGANRSRALY